MPGYSEDVSVMKSRLTNLSTRWDGRSCVLEMMAANYQWKQMEWWAFYFELLCRRAFEGAIQMPGEDDGRVRWDAKGSVNWDLKAKAIKSDNMIVILNDKMAMDASIERFGEHGVLIALCDVEYNDVDRSFEKWRTELEGGESAYTLERRQRTSVSRYRKTMAVPVELLFLRFDRANRERLGVYRQGRNSNGRPRPVKYSLRLGQVDAFLTDRVQVGPPLA